MTRNRLYRADCKIIAEQLKREGVLVDLIYLDPPFNSNRTYSMIFNNRGINAQQKAYHDMWDFTDRTRQLMLDFDDELSQWDLPESFKKFMRVWLNVLEGGGSEDRRLLNYLMYMTQRLVPLRDILKPTGSMYFHCDPTASHYIKVILDGIFGRKNFRNEIIWSYRRWPAKTPNFQTMHDVILRYSRGETWAWNQLAEPLSPATVKRFGSESKQVADFSTGKRLPRQMKGKPSVPMRDVWDISIIAPSAKERRGYATQKPLALLERIMQASSDHGDAVLDPFCGCGTTLEAAERFGRRWIGIDISGDAIDEIKDRLESLGVYDDDDYAVIEGTPDTMAEYTRLNPFEKQEWLVRKLGGLPNPKKSGDLGIDGDMTFHAGGQDAASDAWGKLIFSVKTGKQRKPEHVRELLGTMKAEDAQMGVLIVDVDPTPGMEQAARRAGQLPYQSRVDFPPKSYEKVQIITAYEIIDGATIDRPPSMQDVRRYRDAQTRMRI